MYIERKSAKRRKSLQILSFSKVCWEKRTDSQVVNCRLFSRRIALCSQSEHFTFLEQFFICLQLCRHLIFCVCADGFQVSLTMAIHGFIIGHSWIAHTTCCELQSFPVYGHIWIPLLATPGLAIPPAVSCRIPMESAIHGSHYRPLLDSPYHLL